MSRAGWFRLMAMSAGAALAAMIVRPRRRRAVAPRIAALARWAPSLEPRDTEGPQRAPNGSRAESAPVASVAPPITAAPARPRTRQSGEVNGELAQPAMAEQARANEELRQ